MTVDDRVSDERHARLVATGSVNGESDAKHKATGMEVLLTLRAGSVYECLVAHKGRI